MEVVSMSGFLYGKDAVAILEFLERNGPCSREVLMFLSMKNKYRMVDALKKLETSHYAYRITLDGVEWWLPQGYVQQHGRIDPALQEMAAWLAARLEVEGGHLDGEAAVVPSGLRIAVRYDVSHGIIHLGDEQYCRFDDLRNKEMSLKNCIQRSGRDP
jgi:hypothetical protein